MHMHLHLRNILLHSSIFQLKSAVIVQKSFPVESTERISIALAPDTSTYEALREATFTYSDKFHSGDNPFDFMYAINMTKRCYVITRVGTTSNTQDHHWVLTVIDRTGKVREEIN